MIKTLIPAALTLCLATAAAAEGDAKKGKRVFAKCKACHTVKEGKAKSGPSLYGIIDKAAGTAEGFRYSGAMAESGLTWDVETFSAFLLDPKAVVPGNKMSFRGLKDQADIDDLIAYIQDESS